jgi:hypothetical protein
MDHTIACYKPGCYAKINLSPKDYEQLKRTGESFWCPAGHRQHFTGKTEDQKEIDRLKRRASSLEAEADEIWAEACEAQRQRETAVELIRRCPVCAATPGRHVRIYRDPGRFEDDLANVRDWMAGHIRTEHGAGLPAAKESR